VEAWPGAVRKQENNGRLPLHCACENGCSDEIIQFLVASWPQSAQMARYSGDLPLHIACRGKPSLTVIQSLVQAWPDAVRLQDHYGLFPLHSACENGCTDVAVIEILIQCWPESVRCGLKDHLALHWACRNGKSVLPVIRLLIQAWPDSVREEDGRGYLPLHYACECGCTYDVIQFLVECYPMSLRTRANLFSTLPLHLALQGELGWGRSKLSWETIRFLVQAWPDAIREKDSMGYLPLHYACRYGCTDIEIELLNRACTVKSSLTVIQRLVRAWPDAVRVQDEVGRLPLHVALRFGCTADVVQFLVHAWPESCQVSTRNDMLPLHFACGHQSSAVTLFLLDCYPLAVRFKDNKLQLPLHTACMRETSFGLEVIEQLVRAWTESIQSSCPYAEPEN